MQCLHGSHFFDYLWSDRQSRTSLRAERYPPLSYPSRLILTVSQVSAPYSSPLFGPFWNILASKNFWCLMSRSFLEIPPTRAAIADLGASGNRPQTGIWPLQPPSQEVLRMRCLSFCASFQGVSLAKWQRVSVSVSFPPESLYPWKVDKALRRRLVESCSCHALLFWHWCHFYFLVPKW
jgi:hypothetical protein